MSTKVRISWCQSCQLILFSVFLSFSCSQRQDTSSAKPAILWKNGQAMGLSVALYHLSSVPKESLPDLLKIQLAESSAQTAILGTYTIRRDSLIFEPLIPFTRGLTYTIFFENRLLAEVEIPPAMTSPELIGIYPSQDTLPENLLKFYLVFARPMTEGHSLQFITLCNAKGDTLPDTFLNLQPELWNAERTVLTLWLDPGRIKRDLQPNKLLGTPIIEGNSYTLRVSDQWPDAQGALLKKTYTKTFVTAARDMVSPKIDNWTLKIPPKGTAQPLEITATEALDYVLLQNVLQVVDTKGNPVNGSFQVSEEEKKVRFTPAKPWPVGVYKLQIESRLEDLAGNNLNRLFDRDINNKETLPSEQKVFELLWRID